MLAGTSGDALTSVLVSKVLTRVISLYNPAGDVLGLRSCKNSLGCIIRSQYIGDQEDQNVRLDEKECIDL